ncbi:MAG: UDP-N-acetylglucosamine 1-carboxyvinyltransferase [Kiritimatiellae bacterium]|nr:UDP-N-acetylglucosamine 1-carboxyvinyltransferase [Kiritimatiellia bacterium]
MKRDVFKIEGGRRLSGTLKVSGNKNAALPMIAASLLASEKVVLENVPDILDVKTMLEVVEGFGAKVSRDVAAGTVSVQAGRLRGCSIDSRTAAKIRASVLFAGPLLARCGKACLPPPGGDAIGLRRLDTHFDGFKAMGAKMRRRRDSLSVSGPLHGAEMLLDEASVTATENILMASVLAKGRTVIYNAACEPHVEDLATMLVSMGAKIEGAGTNRIAVEGVESLSGCRARVGCDYIEAGSYIAAAAATGGDITLENVEPGPFKVLERQFARFGVKWEISGSTLRFASPAKGRLRMKYDLGDAVPSIADGPWPAFPSDLVSILVVLATQARGTCLFFEKMFESRLYFVDKLRQMGARIIQCDPHRVVVTGPTRLSAGVVTSPDIRAGIALMIAALAARGTTVIHNASIVDRGYPSVEKALARLGARIERM